MPTNDPTNRQDVKLSGEALKRFRSAEDNAFGSINEMAALIVEAMEGSSERVGSMETVRYYNGAHVLCIHGPEYCYCYDGDLGVCRPCTDAEMLEQ